MTVKELIIKKIEKLPERYVQERMATAIASETSLKKDWLKPEEDLAWQDSHFQI